jgi:hypothetical protein
MAVLQTMIDICPLVYHSLGRVGMHIDCDCIMMNGKRVIAFLR